MDIAISRCCLWSVLFALLKSGVKAGVENYRLCQLEGRNVGLSAGTSNPFKGELNLFSVTFNLNEHPCYYLPYDLLALGIGCTGDMP